ncbi:MAG: hypothetical protein GEV00_11725 [Actinophytocola sp.]|nr:hypothetical protein [Actinophytocola sp.]
MVTKTKGTRVGDLASKRSQAARAEHAARRRIVGAAVAVVGVTTAAVLVFTLAPGATEETRQQVRVTATPTRAADTTDAADPALTVRGTIPKRLGEIAGFGSAAHPDQNTFAINGVVVDPPCELGRSRPVSAHTILLSVTAHTGANARRAGMLGRILTPGFFEAIGPDGRRYPAWPGECTETANALPDDFGPNSDYAGTIELRLPVRSGVLILDGVMTNAAGWEWRF